MDQKKKLQPEKRDSRDGGVLENEVEEDRHIEQRYWIQL